MTNFGKKGGRGGAVPVDTDGLRSKSLSPAKAGGIAGGGFMLMLAIAKFKKGGKRNHETWLQEKEEERMAEIDLRRRLREMAEEEDRLREMDEAANKSNYANIKLQQMKQVRCSVLDEELHSLRMPLIPTPARI
jgi:hypothetical protein